MSRTFLLVLDSFGIGATPDAAAFGDVGANTLGHIADWCAAGHISPERPSGTTLNLPTLDRLGLGRAALNASGSVPTGLSAHVDLMGRWAACAEKSRGKDTPSGHWEMMGVPIMFDWGYFPKSIPCFPEDLTSQLIDQCHLPGLLGNKHASGTDIIEALGGEHIKTGKPIVYTSADSVFQIAAHEDHFGLDRLYHVCQTARNLVDDYNIGRVIARPFITRDNKFYRTGNRKDYAVPPPEQTLLDVLKASGREVISIGKIADIFAHRGLTQKIKATGNAALFDETEKMLNKAPPGSLIFTNFVDFDQDFGHRRNPGGYAAALEVFDMRLRVFFERLEENDLVILTADHGCDPTWPGNDHTREYVPFLSYGKKLAPGSDGLRDSFADIGQTIARYLGVSKLECGVAAY